MRRLLLLPLLVVAMACSKPQAKPQPGSAANPEVAKSDAASSEATLSEGKPKADVRDEILVVHTGWEREAGTLHYFTDCPRFAADMPALTPSASLGAAGGWAGAGVAPLSPA